MDVRTLEFADNTFDVVIDKGTLDSVLVRIIEPYLFLMISDGFCYSDGFCDSDDFFCQCGEGSTGNCNKMCREISRCLRQLRNCLFSVFCCVHRVLKGGGTYIVISYGQPDYRLNYFDKPEYNWNILPAQSVPKPTVSVVEEQDPANVHYIYIMCVVPP